MCNRVPKTKLFLVLLWPMQPVSTGLSSNVQLLLMLLLYYPAHPQVSFRPILQSSTNPPAAKTGSLSPATDGWLALVPLPRIVMLQCWRSEVGHNVWWQMTPMMMLVLMCYCVKLQVWYLFYFLGPLHLVSPSLFFSLSFSLSYFLLLSLRLYAHQLVCTTPLTSLF